MQKVLKKLTDPSYRYVLINTLVSLILFGRNVLFMETLGLADLGQVALMQTIVMLVGFSQLGLINGSYLLYADKIRTVNQKIVNLLWFFLVSLLVLYLIVMSLGAEELGGATIASETLTIGLAAGIATLASTWMNNALIAEGSLAKSNIINVVAIVISLTAALSSVHLGLVAALVSIFIQPLCIMVGALILDPRLRPTKLKVHKQTLNKVFALGIMQFFGGVATLMSYQLERWAIVIFLGDESLGRFYLVIMYMAFFILIPASLLNLYFPRASQALINSDFNLYKKIMRIHLRDLTIYCILAVICTVLFLPWTLQTFFPQFVGSATLIFLLLPTMIVFVFRDVVSLVLYSSKNTQPILVSGIILISFYAMLIFGSAYFEMFSLDNLIVFRGVAVVISTLYLFYIRHKILNEIVIKYANE